MKSRRTRVCLSVVLQANTVFYEKSSGHRSHLRQSHKCLPQDKDHILERSRSAPCALPILSYGILKRCALKGLDLIKLIFIASSGHFKVSPWLFFLQRHGTEQHNGYSCPCFCIQVQLSTQSKKKKKSVLLWKQFWPVDPYKSLSYISGVSGAHLENCCLILRGRGEGRTRLRKTGVWALR